MGRRGDYLVGECCGAIHNGHAVHDQVIERCRYIARRFTFRNRVAKREGSASSVETQDG